MHITVVEDNLLLQKSIMDALEYEGYVVSGFSDGAEAYHWLTHQSKRCDLVILDVLLPNKDGFAIVHDLRNQNITTPVLMLTSKDTVDDIVTGFTYGADDYMKKPFALEELLARIHALLQRPWYRTSHHVSLTPDITLDMNKRTAFSRKGTIHLTAKEFSLLEYLVQNTGHVVTQQDIYDHVFDPHDITLSNTVEVHIKNIRKKLRTNTYDIPLTTIRGAGYRLDLS